MPILSSPAAAAAAYRLSTQRITPTGTDTVDRMGGVAQQQAGRFSDVLSSLGASSAHRIPNPISQISGTSNSVNPMLVPSQVGSAQVVPSLNNVLGQALERSADTVQAGEDMSIAAVMGKANINDVVMAVSEAQLTLKTIMVVRDKVLDAYREILRSTI